MLLYHESVQSSTVGQIHREYLKAGATALKTNTFAANPGTLPDPEQLRTVLQAGLEIAQKAAAEHGAEVFADIGGISATDAGPSGHAI